MWIILRVTCSSPGGGMTDQACDLPTGTMGHRQCESADACKRLPACKTEADAGIDQCRAFASGLVSTSSIRFLATRLHQNGLNP